MREGILLVTVLAVLYGLWMLLGLVFQMIDVYHRGTSAAEPRNVGVEQAEERGY